MTAQTNGPPSEPSTAPPTDAQLPGWGLHWDGGLHYNLGVPSLLERRQRLHPDTEVKPLQGDIGLKLQWDGAAYDADRSLGAVPDDAGIRRARLYTRGGFFSLVPISYKVEAEVVDRDFYVREAYAWLWDIPVVQTIKVGHFKAPMSLEGYMGSGNTLLPERAAPVDAFAPGIMYGVQLGGANAKRTMTWAGGGFADGGQSDISESSRSFSRVIGRVTWLARDEPTGHGPRLLHFGTAAHYLYSQDSSVRYRARPESYFAPRLVDTDAIDARNATSVGLECAAVEGPFCVQSEAFLAMVPYSPGQDMEFYGAYLAAGWLLTGESRPYDRQLGTLGRPRPAHPWSLRDLRFGAWELASRASWLDLSDGHTQGGALALYSLGLNGYLTDALCVRFCGGYGQVRDTEKMGDLRIAQVRLQLEF